MAETNKSQMMSEAEIIEAINADSLISVSLGAGQPQKNVKMSTLASVAAGLMDFVKFKSSTSIIDADNILTNLVILNMDILKNVPYNYGTLFSIGNESHVFQLYAVAEVSKNSLYFRQRTSSVWSPWAQLV